MIVTCSAAIWKKETCLVDLRKPCRTQLEYPSKDEVGSIRFHSQPRRWLHVDKSGKLEYRTVRNH
jgi:hypothetical protein